MHKNPKTRCVNIDWLEVYCLESNERFPCNADYFRSRGFIVHEREYGTRQYNEMFTLEDERRNKWLEIRRNPASGSSSFSGKSEISDPKNDRATYRKYIQENPSKKLTQNLADKLKNKYKL